jgi:hypothetical protein
MGTESEGFISAGLKRNLKNRWVTYDDPRLTAKFLRHSEKVARELGVADDVKAFDEAAKAFANSPPIVAATLVVYTPFVHCLPAAVSLTPSRSPAASWNVET